MKSSELRECSIDELNQKVNNWKEELFRVKFSSQGNEKKNTSLHGKTRRLVARALTLINEKEKESK